MNISTTAQVPDASPESVPEDAAERRTVRTKGKRRSWQRWVANLMIIGGVLCLPGYFLGSCGYTWLQQRELREDLEQSSPGMTISLAGLVEEDFVPIEIGADTAEATAGTDAENAASQAEEEAIAAAIAAAKARRDAQLAAFRAAADAFATSVGGQTAVAIGRIIIPSIGVDVVMLEGTSTSDLKEGPGHWEETPFPGQGGNFVVSGHRTTYGAPFFKLNDVKVGDEIDLVLPYVVARYRVTKVMVVYPDEVETVAQRGREQVSLAACHPIYSAKQRIVVQGDLAGFKLIESEG